MHFLDALETPTPDPEHTLVWANTVDPLAEAAAVNRVSLIVLDFPKWTDGRAYSQAALLRSRLRYRGELRAAGEVVADMAPLLARCGFDSAVLAPGQSVEIAQRALGFFPGHYQGDISGGRPRFEAAAQARQERGA